MPILIPVVGVLFGRPFEKRFAVCYGTVVLCLSVCLSCLSVCAVGVLWPSGQTVRQIKMKLGVQVGLGPGHIVLDGDPAPLPQRAIALCQFSAHICCSQMAACIKMPVGTELGLGPGDFVLDGDPASSPKRGRSPPTEIFGPCLL